MVNETRARKIAERFGEILAEIFQREIADPRLQDLTITDVEVDRELAFATIYVSALGEDVQIEEILRALEGAKGYLRSQLAARVQLRSHPQLRFRWDPAPERGARIDELLEILKREKEGSEGQADE